MRALVVDDDSTLRLTVRMALESQGYFIEEAQDGEEAVKKVEEQAPFDVVLLDVNMPKMDGITALEKIKSLSPQTFCLILTAYSDVKDAVKAIKAGAYDYVEKPVDAERIIKIVNAASEASALVEAVAFSAPSVKFDEGRTMIGGSSEIKRVFDIIHKLSKVDTSVLIRGESGTGKELVARAIHFNSHRKDKPFVAVNCAAIPENLIESELFGHEKGSFTGADKKKIGRFQFAEGGTLFLDEIGDISAATQVKLLRVLQERAFTPVGANKEIKADVRVVAATHRPLEEMIGTGAFRSDLFYRLNVLPIVLPPLRDRREDIPPLVEFMIKKFNKLHARNIKKIDKRALGALTVYRWAGNIRELENVIEHAFILESSEQLTYEALPDHIKLASEGGGLMAGDSRAVRPAGAGNSAVFDGVTDLNFPALKEKFEQEFLIKALKAFKGKINQTAENTKMTKVTLLRKLEKYGIDPKEYRE